MRLSDFILENMEPILQEWEDFARSLSTDTGRMSVVQLRDHAEDMLRTMAADLACAQTEAEGIRKSHGIAPRQGVLSAAETHAQTRLTAGFTIDQLISEYRALRASVLRLRAKASDPATSGEIREITRFNEAVDQALAESVARYTEMGGQARDIFIGILGHDLRSPLQAVSFGSEILMRPAARESDLHQLGKRMFASCRRMAEMLDNLLDFAVSRVGEGIAIKAQEVNLAELAEQVVDEFRAARPQRAVRLAVIGDVRGHFDPGRIAQVYQNLIGNALQHGTGDVSVSTEGQNDRVRIAIHNEGTPIPPDERDHIFDLFYRHARRTDGASVGKNLGLGLYITKEIVKSHGGFIETTSTAEDGTIFTVTLPKHAQVGATT